MRGSLHSDWQLGWVREIEIEDEACGEFTNAMLD